MIRKVIFKEIPVDFHKSAFQNSVVSCMHSYKCKCTHICTMRELSEKYPAI